MAIACTCANRSPRSVAWHASPHASASVQGSMDREVVMRELDDLRPAEVINIRAHVGDDLCCNVFTMLLGIGDPLVRRICLSIPVAKQQDGASRGKGLA